MRCAHTASLSNTSLVYDIEYQIWKGNGKSAKQIKMYVDEDDAVGSTSTDVFAFGNCQYTELFYSNVISKQIQVAHI